MRYSFPRKSGWRMISSRWKRSVATVQPLALALGRNRSIVRTKAVSLLSLLAVSSKKSPLSANANNGDVCRNQSCMDQNIQKEALSLAPACPLECIRNAHNVIASPRFLGLRRARFFLPVNSILIAFRLFFGYRLFRILSSPLRLKSRSFKGFITAVQRLMRTPS